MKKADIADDDYGKSDDDSDHHHPVSHQTERWLTSFLWDLVKHKCKLSNEKGVDKQIRKYQSSIICHFFASKTEKAKYYYHQRYYKDNFNWNEFTTDCRLHHHCHHFVLFK